MAFVPYPLARSFLFELDPEKAHDLTLGALARIQHTPLVCTIAQPRVDDPVTVAGIRFPNRLGLAAGLDKNGWGSGCRPRSRPRHSRATPGRACSACPRRVR